jgi:hypothetical protein
MEGSCSTGQSPQWAVVPVEEEEEVYHLQCQKYEFKVYCYSFWVFLCVGNNCINCDKSGLGDLLSLLHPHPIKLKKREVARTLMLTALLTLFSL